MYIRVGFACKDLIFTGSSLVWLATGTLLRASSGRSALASGPGRQWM